MVVDDTHELPALRGDRGPAVGIPSELRALRMVPTVVLDGDPIVGVGEVESRDEATGGVSQHPVHLWLGKPGADQDEPDEGFARRLRTRPEQGERCNEFLRSAPTQSRRSVGKIVRTSQLASQDGVSDSDQVVEPHVRRELCPDLSGRRHRKSVAHSELLRCDDDAMTQDASGSRLTCRRDCGDMQILPMRVRQGEVPERRGRVVAEELSGGEPRLV